ncbi:MAG: cation transporter [Bacilli bacterium]|nr:cation transporter [Bacilli bacterium]
MNREKKIIQTSFIGIGGNLLLVAGKAIIGFIAGSVSIILDAVNNLSDALSSIITIVGTKLSTKKPDKKHPYGHGRIEYLTSLVIAVIVLVAGGSAIYESIQSLISQTQANYSDLSLIIISIAILVKIALGLYYRKVAKDVNSDALKGSGTDALFDSLLSLATLIGAIIARYTGMFIEGYLGIVIGLFIIKSGIEILSNAVSNIIGERSSNEIAIAIKQTVNSFPEVIGSYDLILNNYGPNRAIGSIHIEVNDQLTAKEIHPLTRKIAQEVYAKFGVILTIGIYASNTSNPEILQIRKDIRELVKKYQNIKQTHGFYVDEELKQISFDILIDFDEEHPEELQNSLVNELKKLHPNYDYSIVIDNDFTD